MIDDGLIRRVLEHDEFSIVYQPVYSLARGTVSDLEALTRFAPSTLGPASWFAVAHAAGLGVDLELATARRALDTGDRVPADVCLWVNLSSAALADPRAKEMLVGYRSSALGVEVTGQVAVAGTRQLEATCRGLQEAGIRIAVDDAAGHRAGRRRVTRLRPDQVKADLTVTRMLESTWWHRRRARRMVIEAHRRGAMLVGKGVETPVQLGWWARLGADSVQGFLLAPPAPLAKALSSGPISPARECGERRLSAVA